MTLPLNLHRDPLNDRLIAVLDRLEAYDFSRVNDMCAAKFGWSCEDDDTFDHRIVLSPLQRW